jgi:hypothetical protein|tara:strand:- start:1569 stop:1757 length:189 start_codon:yes stop_codon:yes gene_type:complete
MIEPKNTLRKYIRLILQEANEYQWDVADDDNLMLDEEGMEKSDRENVSQYLKSMALMKNGSR